MLQQVIKSLKENPKMNDLVPLSIISRSQSAMSHVSNFTQQTPSQPNLAQQQPSAVFVATVPTQSPGLTMSGMMSPPSMTMMNVASSSASAKALVPNMGVGHNMMGQANNTAQMIQQPQVQGRMLEPNSASQMMQPQMHGQIPAPQMMPQQQLPQMGGQSQQQQPMQGQQPQQMLNQMSGQPQMMKQQHQLQSQMSQIPPPSPQGNPFDVY